MGRAFEYRKARKLKRWGNMARVFTRLGLEANKHKGNWQEEPSVFHCHKH